MEEPLAGSRKHSTGLLLFRFCLDKAHLRALRRDDNCPSVNSIALLSFHEVARIALISST